MKKYIKKTVYSIRFKFAAIFALILIVSAFISFPITINFAKYNRNISDVVVFGLILCNFLGGMLMWLAVTFITRPIKKLTAATKKVAIGNFDVNVNYSKKDEIGTLISNFNLMTKELGHMEYMRKDFLTSVSHEFKTPIASIKGFAKLLESPDTTPEDARKYLSIIEEEAGRLSNLTSNILRLTNIENQAILSKPVKFSLDEQLRKTILLFTDRWESKKLDMDIQLDRVDYEGDDELTQQIWINLIDNAIKFSEPHGTVSVYLRKVGDDITVTVADNGIGIAEEKQARIFDKFYQADSSHSTSGNGLGLSIVKSILDLIHGSIELNSKEEEGTVFTVRLKQYP